MPKTKKSPQQIAEEQVAAEEAARREKRINEIVAKQEAELKAERVENEAVEARGRAAEEAEKLADQRKAIEDRLATVIAEIAPDVEELIALHDKHRQALKESLDPEYNVRVRDGIMFSPGPDWMRSNQDIRDILRRYLEGSLPVLYPKAKTPAGTLSEVDPLTPLDPEDPAGRPAGPYPWERLEAEKRKIEEDRAQEQERRRAHAARQTLEDLQRRHQRLRADYSRPVGYKELVAAEERQTLEELCTDEELERFEQTIEEQNGRGGRGGS